MRAFVDGNWRTVSGGRVFVNGAWRSLVSARAFVGGSWREIASFVQPLSLGVSPEVVRRAVTEGTTRETVTVTATPTGGRLPITYAWTRVSGDTSITIVSPTASATRFSRFVPDTGEYTGVFRCTATDADGRTAQAQLEVTFFGVIEPTEG